MPPSILSVFEALEDALPASDRRLSGNADNRGIHKCEANQRASIATLLEVVVPGLTRNVTNDQINEHNLLKLPQ